MSIHFEVKTPLDELDTPVVNLRNKKFSEVRLLCMDESILFTTDPQKHKENLAFLKKSVYGETICIELYKDHLTFIDRGKLNILPYSMITRWVIE